MGKKIFVSYKYGDNKVKKLDRVPWYEETTVRHYVDELQEKLDKADHIYKGEADGEDLSDFTDETIWSKLRDKIYDSSITIVMISKNMKERYSTDETQWIPWEISYSLSEYTRNDRTSKTNAVLAVVIPDENGRDDYYWEERACCVDGCTNFFTSDLFGILKNNMFNKKNPRKYFCTNKSVIQKDYHSYIYSVKWEKFIRNINFYLNIAMSINENIDDYNIQKTV